jgi:hypothetical protein
MNAYQIVSETLASQSLKAVLSGRRAPTAKGRELLHKAAKNSISGREKASGYNASTRFLRAHGVRSDTAPRRTEFMSLSDAERSANIMSRKWLTKTEDKEDLRNTMHQINQWKEGRPSYFKKGAGRKYPANYP